MGDCAVIEAFSRVLKYINLVTILVTMVTFVSQSKSLRYMQVIPLSKFRTNQTATLLRAIQGESVFLTSRIGDFKLVPVSVEEKIATRIREGLNEVKRIEAGEQPAKSANAFLEKKLI
ncbi:hypothetical protein NXW13_00555 (plasmid) [Bacteroides thetaiotaomicron]|nr:hypothetical protein [Bacteroides thetaiotaomicron]